MNIAVDIPAGPPINPSLGTPIHGYQYGAGSDWAPNP